MFSSHVGSRPVRWGALINKTIIIFNIRSDRENHLECIPNRNANREGYVAQPLLGNLWEAQLFPTNYAGPPAHVPLSPIK